VKGRRRWVAGGCGTAALLVLGYLGVWGYIDGRSADPQEVLLFGADKWTPGSVGLVRVVARNGQTQAPIDGAEVRVGIGSAKVDGITGRDGSVGIAIPAPEKGGRLVVRVVSAYGSDRLERDISIERSWRLLVSADKPLYQPSQTMHLRTMAFDSFTQKPSETDLTLEVEDPNGNRVFKKSIRTSAFGIASADFALADEVNLGTYRIRASIGETRSERTVEVKRYVLPTFKVDLRPDRSRYGPGDWLRAALEARYMFGKPVADAPVKVVLRRWTGRGFEPFAEIAARTDREGKASVDTRLPDRFVGTEPDAGAAELRIEASVTDGAGHSETAVKALTVSGQALRIQLIPEASRLIEGIEQKLYVVVSYPDGTPAAARVSLQGETVTYDTDETGVAILSVTSAPSTVVARDAAGNRGEASTHYPFEYWHASKHQDFLLRPDRVSYKAGGRAKITVLSASDGVVYVDLVKSGQTVLARSVEVRKGKGDLVVDLPLDLSGMVRFTGYRILSGGQVLRASRLAAIERPEELRIRATAGKGEFRPGEEIDLAFEVTDPSGNPAPSALGLSVVDEAVFALQEARPGFEKTFFQIEEDLLRPRAQMKPVGPLAGDELSPIRLAAAAQPLVTPLASISYQTKAAQVYHTARDMKEFSFGAFLVLLAAGFVGTLCWALYRGIQGAWSGLINVACLMFILLLVGAIGLPGLLSSQRASNERSAAQQARVLEMEAAAMAATASTDPSAPRIREHFPETLYWNPELITDEKGRASLKIPGADSITTWRMSMSAVTREGKLGAGDHPLRVFQPFFVDLDLPVALTQGDEVWLPVAVHNYLKERQTVALTLEADEGFEIADQRTQSVSVGPGDVTSARFHLRARRFGRHALLVRAVGPAFSDAVRRSVDVLPDGKEIPVSVCDRLKGSSRATVTIPEASVDGATRLWVRVFPSNFSEIVTGLEGLIRMPYG